MAHSVNWVGKLQYEPNPFAMPVNEKVKKKRKN